MTFVRYSHTRSGLGPVEVLERLKAAVQEMPRAGGSATVIVLRKDGGSLFNFLH